MPLAIAVDRARVEEFCHKWRVKELAIFGSALREEDFRPDSDVDVLVVFEEGAEWDLFDHMHAEEELARVFDRKVDLVSKEAIRNPFRRHHILAHHEVIYAA
jgi:predicted nucleotidyltransferase